MIVSRASTQGSYSAQKGRGSKVAELNHGNKGNGRARHGSIRSPIWIGGGITFEERNFSRKIPQK